MHGEIFSFDTKNANLLVLRQLRGRNTASIQIVKMQYIQDVVVHGPPPPNVDTHLLAPNPKLLEEREQAAIADFARRRHTRGIAVTKEAQDLFDFVHKFHGDCEWVEENRISVMGVRINPSAEKIENVCEGLGPEVDRVRQMVEGFRRRRDVRRQESPAIFGENAEQGTHEHAESGNRLRVNYASPSPSTFTSDPCVGGALQVPSHLQERRIAPTTPGYYVGAVEVPSAVPTATAGTVTTQEDVPMAYSYLPYFSLGMPNLPGANVPGASDMAVIPTVSSSDMMMLQQPATIIPTTGEPGGQMVVMLVQPGLGQGVDGAAQAIATGTPQLGRHPGYYGPLLLTAAPLAGGNGTPESMLRQGAGGMPVIPVQGTVDVSVASQVGAHSVPIENQQARTSSLLPQQQRPQMVEQPLIVEGTAFGTQAAYAATTIPPSSTAASSSSSSMVGDTQTNVPPVASQRQPTVARTLPSCVSSQTPSLAADRSYQTSDGPNTGDGIGAPTMDRSPPPPPPPAVLKPFVGNVSTPLGITQQMPSENASCAIQSRPNVPFRGSIPLPPPILELSQGLQQTNNGQHLVRSSGGGVATAHLASRPSISRNTPPLQPGGRSSMPPQNDDSNPWGLNPHPHSLRGPMTMPGGNQGAFRLSSLNSNKTNRSHQRRTNRRRD